MVANFTQKLSYHQQLLIDQLCKLPVEWALTPVKGNKACYRTSWQFESPLSHQELITEIKSGKAKGYGIRTGKVSGGIVAIDADGHAAHDKIIELSGNVPLPETIAFTSNKPGRCQYLFYIPQEYWDAIATKKIGTGVKGDDGKEQKLELRWDGCQSVLPPSIHPETGYYRWRNSPEENAIAPAPMWVIQMMLKESGEAGASLLNRQPDAHQNWTDFEWALSYLNALSPSRADDYEDWLAVGMALHSLNDDSLLLEWDDWSKMSSKYKVGACEKKWKSFKRQGVAIGTLAHMAKQDGWRSHVKSSGRGVGAGIGFGGGKRRGKGGAGGSGGDGSDGGDDNIVPFPDAVELTAQQVSSLIDEIIEQSLTGSELHAALNVISHRTPWRIDQVKKLYEKKLADVERIELRGNTRDQLESLLSASSASLDLKDYLNPILAKPLLHLASRLSLKPELYLTTLLTVASSLHHPLTRIWLSKEDDFSQPPQLLTGIVAPSSQKKSPLLKGIATKPLRILQKEAERKYKLQMEDYKRKVLEWEKAKGDDKGPFPEEPQRKIHFFTKATGEGLEYQAARQPDQGMLYLSDELPAIINGQNAYRQGRGSDRQDLLSYYDGTGHVTLRAEGVKSEIDSILLSILGGVQPKVMQKLLADCEDSDGTWARFLFVNQPAVAARLHPDGGQIDLTELLTGLYRDIRSLPQMEYTLSPEAFKLFQQAYDRYEQNRVNDPLIGMQSVWGKCEGRVGRLALNLHVVNALAANEIPSDVIEADTIARAIALTDYYAMQVKAMYTEFSDSDALAPHLAKVIELSLKTKTEEGWLKASDVYLSITKKHRPSGEAVREWFGELVLMGKGEVRGQGRTLQFRSFRPNESPPPIPPSGELDDFRQILDESSKAETTAEQELQPILDKLDNLDDFQKNNNLERAEEPPVVELDNPAHSPPMVQLEPLEKILEQSSNLSKVPQTADTVCDTALDDLSKESSKLDELDNPGQPDDRQTMDRNQLSDRVEKELSRLGWSVVQIRVHLVTTYKKKSPKNLTDSELLDFLAYLSQAPAMAGEQDKVVDLMETEEAIAQIADADTVEYKRLIAESDVELKRMNWDKQQGCDHLLKAYGKRSRHLLTNEELRGFVQFLKAQPEHSQLMHFNEEAK